MAVVGKGVTVTARVLAALVPQPLLAVTDTFPEVVLVVAVILLVVLEPVHPPGKVQVYVEAPDTDVIE